MYPDFFVQNYKTGSSTTPCSCSINYASNEEQIGSDESDKYFPNQTDKELSKGINYWSQQTGKNVPHRPISMPMSFPDQYTDLCDSPPYRPRKRSYSASSCSSDESNGESKKQVNGLDLLVGAIDDLESHTADSPENGSSLMCTADIENEFADLYMLAEEAVKRIEARTPTTK